MADEGNRRRVLLVEDEASDRVAVLRALSTQEARCTLLEAATGEEGIALSTGSAPPDCILLDFYLRDMTALEFLERLRGREGGPVPFPVVVLTDHDDDRAAAAALKAGAEDFLVKDAIDPRSLTRAIENAVERHRIRRELEEQRAAVESRNRQLEALHDELQSKVLELADATKAKDRFLAVMSHEMRTPLNAILGYSDLLDLEIDGELTEGQRAHLQRIRVGSRHLLDLINNVLDLTRADVRKLELDIRPVDAVAVVEEVVGLLEGEARISGLALVFEQPDAGIPLVSADLQRLRQVVTNLVGNALKFTDEGSVTVAIEAPDEATVRVRVTDTGIGIEPDAIPLVFDEFYQVRGDLTRRHGGSGLGLAISRQLADLMGGTISARSTLGRGSTFTLTLQTAEAGALSRVEDALAHQQWVDSRPVERPPIVVVALGPDDTSLAELERRVAPAVRLVWTTDPERLVDLAVAERPSLVMVDIGAMDSGWNAAVALQEITELRDTAVLLLPTIPAPHLGEPAPGVDLGWVSLVPKPFTAAQLTVAVSRATGRQLGGAGADKVCDVLVVDDDADSRRVAAKFLLDHHVRVREAADGESALESMRTTRPDIVVLDLMMPVLDGFGVLAAMRADPVLRGIPVVVLTAKSLTEAERQFLSKTAARVLQKGQHRLADVAALVLRAASQPSGAGV